MECNFCEFPRIISAVVFLTLFLFLVCSKTKSHEAHESWICRPPHEQVSSRSCKNRYNCTRSWRRTNKRKKTTQTNKTSPRPMKAKFFLLSDLRRWFLPPKHSLFVSFKVEIFVRFPWSENIGLVWFLCFRWCCRICLCTWRRSFSGIAGLKEYLSVTGTANLGCLCCLPMKQLLYMMWSCHFGYPNIVCLGPLEMSSHKSCLQLLGLTQAM